MWWLNRKQVAVAALNNWVDLGSRRGLTGREEVSKSQNTRKPLFPTTWTATLGCIDIGRLMR